MGTEDDDSNEKVTFFHDRRNQQRPSVLAEVRAWVLVALAIIVHTIGVTWWGATLSSNLASLKDIVVQYQIQYNAIELRVRDLEKDNARIREQLRVVTGNK